jgi:hypothetical protein
MFELYFLRVLLEPRFKVRRPFRERLPFWERFRLERLARRVFLAPPPPSQLLKLNIGLFDRFGYSIYPYVGFESIHWIAGITYDINNTNQKKYNYPLQSIEISIGWLFNNDKKRERIRSVTY